MSTAELLAAFEENPGDHKAFDALIRQVVADDDRDTLGSIYDRLPEWADGETSRLFQVLAQHARMAKAKDIASFMHYRNGLIFWKHFGDEKKAEMSFRKMKASPPDPDLLREFYIGFYSAQDNWRRLEQFLSDPKMGGMSDKAEVQRLLARLAEDKGKPDKAVSFWQNVHNADPSDAEAEGALRRLYAEVGKWHAMVDLLKGKIKQIGDDDPVEAIALHKEMIDIYKEHLNAAAKAVSAWQAILDLDPGNTDALDALAEEYEGMKRWPDLVKVLRKKIDHTEETERIIALHERVATIMLDKFNNSTEAIKSYEAILEIAPENEQAIATLKEVYESRRDWDNYILVAEREVALRPEGPERDAAFIDLARLASERIRKPETPIALWERVREADPGHDEALEQLEQLYEREKNYEALASVLETRSSLAELPADKVAILDKLGQVYESRLNDADKGAGVWRRVLEIDKDHRKAQAQLKKKYTDAGDWENLEWFFRTYMTVQDWVRTLESQAKKVDDPADRTTLLFKAAAVWQHELEETRRAVKNLEAVLEIEPRHAQAASMLVPIYREVGSWSSLPAVYDIVLEGTEEADERRRILLELAEVQENKLKDLDSAFFAFVQAVQESPNEVSLHAELKRLAEASENWDSYVVVLQDTVDLIEMPADQVNVLLEIGQVYRDRVQVPETALDFFNRALSLDGENATALDALEGLYAQIEAYDQLIAIYDKKLRITLGGPARKQLLRDLAGVWRGKLGNNREAEAIYREMLEDFPEDTGVHDDLIGVYLEEQRYQPLRDVLEMKRDILVAEPVPAVLADVECDLGMLSYGTNPTPEGVGLAVEHYEAALGHDPQHLETVSRLEELLADEAQRLRITRLLEPVYRERADWEKLADVLEIQLLAAEGEEDVHAQIGLLERLSELYRDSLANADLAWRSYGRLFLHQPEREEVRLEFERLTYELDRWPQLVALYTDRAEDAPDTYSRLAIKLEVARAWHKRIEDLEKARVFYHKVLDEEPEHKEAIDALEGIYVALDRAEDLLDIYRRKIDLSADIDQKLDYLFRTSDLLRDRLGRHGDAVTAAQEALDLQPGHLPALLRLDELYTATEQWAELVRILEDTIRLIREDAARVVVLQSRLAGVHGTYLEDVPTAIQLYAGIFELDDSNQTTVEALEQLFKSEDWAPQIAPIIQPYYDRVGDWQKLIEVYTVREGASDDILEKVDWHYKIAALYENEGQMPESAFEHFMAAAALDPGSERTLGELLRLADMLDNHGELVLHLQSLVDEIIDDYRRRETHRTIAVLARDKTGDTSGAEKHFRAILEVEPADMDAINDLIALYRQLEQPEQLVETLMMKAPMVEDMELKQELYAEAGELSAGVLDKPDTAIEIYEQLHALDPTKDRALDALEILYEMTERWEELIGVYQQKIDRASELDTRKQYASMKGHVQADKQNNPDDAILTWRQILEWDPQEIAALNELDQLYSKLEDWYNLLDVLTKMQALVDEQGWAEAQYRIAKLYESDDRLADIHQAIGAYGKLLERQPDHEGAVDSLKAIIAKRDERESAFAVLKPVLGSRGAFEELWEQYETIAANQDMDPFRQVETLHEMAALAEHQLADPGRAFGAQARAFKLDRQNQTTVGELERLAEAHEMWEELVSLYLAGAEDADPFLAQGLLLKTGAILMDRIGDPERAIGTYKRVYEDAPDHREVQDRLHRLYEAQGMHTELVDVLRNQIETATEVEDKILFLTRLAEVSEQQLGDADAAYEAYMEVLNFDGNSELGIVELQRLYVQGVHRLDIAERLEPIYTEREAWEDLHGLLELKLEVLNDVFDRLSIMRQLAELNLNKLDSKPEAILWYGRAFRLDAEDDGLLQQLYTLAEETDRWDEVKAILMDGAEAVDDDVRRIDLWNRAAAISRDRMGDIAEAERVYRLILGADDQNFKALSALDDIYVAAERWDDLEPVLAVESQVAEFDDDRIRLLVRLAELYRDYLGDRVKAIAAYRQVLDINDMHVATLTALQDMYRTDESWPELYAILQQLADTSREPADRARYMAEMARIAEDHLDRAEDAVELWEQVLSMTPDNREAVWELQRLQETQERWDDLVRAYERELNMGVEDPARRLDLYKRMGRVWQIKLEDGLAAQMYWEKAREEDPFDRESMESLRLIYRENYAFAQLGGILEAQLTSDHYESDEQLALWRELAELRTESLGDKQGGIEAWRAVMVLSPGDSAAIANLEQLFEEEQMWSDAVELNRIKLEYIDDDQTRIETWLYAAQLQQERLGDPGAAAQTYRDILQSAPDNFEASTRLEAIYEGGEQWEDLANLLLDRNSHLPEREDRVMNLNRLANIYEHKLFQPENAFMVLESAIVEVPDDPQTMIELSRLAEVTGMWREMLTIYDNSLEHLDDFASLDVMLKAAAIQRDKLQSPADAASYYERVLAVEEENEVALRALVDLNQELARWEPLVKVLETLAEIAMDYSEKMQLYARAADVYENQLGDRDRAVNAWSSILEVDEVDKTALTALERLHEERQDWRALIEILERVGRTEPHREAELKLRIAGILEHNVGEVDEAIAVYEDVLNYDPTNEIALEALEVIYGEREDWSRLVDVYDRSYDAATSDEQRADFCRKVALIQREVFRNMDDAAEAFQRILYLIPNDAEALEALETIYRNGERYEDLVELLERKREVADDEQGRAGALYEMAVVYRDQLLDIDNAIQSFERVITEVPTHRESLDALEKLYTEQAMWEQVIDVTERKLTIETDPEVRLMLLCQQGAIRNQELGDPLGAARFYDRALTERPGYDPAVEALVEIYTREERFDLVVETLSHKLSSLHSEADKAPVHVALADVWRDKLDAPGKALEHLEKAVAADPESETTLWPLADHYMAVENWTKAMPLLDVLVDKLEGTNDVARLAQVHKRLGMCAEALYDNARALDEYRAAVQLAPPDFLMLRGLAGLNFKQQNWQEARRYYQQIVDEHMDELADSDRTETYLKLGESALNVGDIQAAQQHLAQVIENQPHNEDAIEQIIQVLEAHGDWSNAIMYKEQLLDLKHEPLEKFTIQISIGDIYREHMRDSMGAAEAYRKALDHGNFSKAPLLQLVQIYAEDKNYTEAIRALMQLIESEDEAAKKARYAWTIAVMYRDELGDTEQTIKYLNLVLDYDLGKLEAFRAVDEMLTQAREWKMLEQNYRRMIQRVQKAGSAFEKGPALLFMLYKNLGEIYRSRLRRMDYAISAFELACKQRPKDVAIREILAGLYEGTKDSLDKAVAQHRFLIKQHPERFESYEKLIDLYKRMGLPDRSWCVAGLLVSLGKAKPESERFYYEYVSSGVAETTRSLDNTLWSEGVMSPYQDEHLGQIFALVFQSRGKANAQKTLKDFGLKKRDKVDLNEHLLFCSTFNSVARILALPTPDVYRSSMRMGIEILPVYPPVLSVGPDMMQGKSEKELAFHLAKRLTYFHPNHILAALYPHDHLDLMFMAANSIVDPAYSLPLPPSMPQDQIAMIAEQVGLLRAELDKNMTPQHRAQLASVLNEFRGKNKVPKIGVWHRQVELTANHAGLLVADDIELVGRILRDEVGGSSKLSRGDKLKDLVMYVLSDRYMNLREQMGTQIDYSELFG